MTEYFPFLARLDLAPDADARAIRRAYARELKLIDQETDAAGFQSLRAAYDTALFWERHREAIALEKAEPIRVASEDESGVDDGPPAPVFHQHTGPSAPPPTPPDDQQALAAAVFGEFVQRCATLVAARATGSDAPWQHALRASLDDERLINIIARELFEQRVAEWLAQGWRPGNEALLPAATKVFNWDGDRRRVQALGHAGAVIDDAIDERAMFASQDDTDRQQHLIERLRQPHPPSARELVMNTVPMEVMISRFPTWLGLIVSADNVVRWREMERALPGWRRMLAFTGWRKGPFDGEQRGWRINWTWLIFFGVLTLARMSCHELENATSFPARDNYASLVATGDQRHDANDYDGAIASYTRAIQVDPGKAKAYVYRALAGLDNGVADQQIVADLDKADELEKSNAVVPRVRGLLALRQGRNEDAAEQLSRSLQLLPDDTFTLDKRAQAYAWDKHYEQALADIAHRLKTTQEKSAETYSLRMLIHLQLGEPAKALEQIEPMLKVNKDYAGAYRFVAGLHIMLDQRAQAMAILDRGIAAAPAGELYLFRATLRPRTDIAGRRDDIQHATAFSPASLPLLKERVALEVDDGKLDAAVKILSDDIKADKTQYAEQPIILAYRSIVYRMMGQPSLADEDLKTARTAAGTRRSLNNLAWFLAQRDAALPEALSAVDAALKQAPDDATYLDTKGLVLLQMKRYQEAIEAYSAALKIRPDLRNSLYGRGVAKRRLGDNAGADADLAEARKNNLSIDKDYADYGLKP